VHAEEQAGVDDITLFRSEAREHARRSPRALAHLILSIVEESSLMVLNAIDLEITRAEVEMAILSLLSAIEPGGRRQPESRRETDRGRTERQGRQARHTG